MIGFRLLSRHRLWWQVKKSWNGVNFGRTVVWMMPVSTFIRLSSAGDQCEFFDSIKLFLLGCRNINGTFCVTLVRSVFFFCMLHLCMWVCVYVVLKLCVSSFTHFFEFFDYPYSQLFYTFLKLGGKKYGFRAITFYGLELGQIARYGKTVKEKVFIF